VRKIRHVDTAIYIALADAYRVNPAKHSMAAGIAGVHRHTARKVWTEGVPSKNLKPIKDLIHDERFNEIVGAYMRGVVPTEQLEAVEIRALKASEDALNTRVSAQRDAIQAMAQESKMVGLGRENIITSLNVTSVLLEAGTEEAKKLRDDLLNGNTRFTPFQKISFIKNCVSIMRQLSEAAKLNMEMERLITGEPTEIVGFKAEHMTEKEAMRTLILAQRAVERAKESGQLTPELESAMMSSDDPGKPN
jgi:hypothetical protein